MTAIDELCALLKESGLRVTFDSGRDITKACTFCGEREQRRTLEDIGRYFNGDMLTRPVCERCKPLVALRGKAP